MESKNTICKFLENNKIPNRYIWFYISDATGKKTPIGEKNNIKDVNEIKTIIDPTRKPKQYNFYNWTTKSWDTYILSKKEFDSLQLAYSIYLKHAPENIYCIDIDDATIDKDLNKLIEKCPEFAVLKDCSYLEGNTKGIHIYCKIEGLPSNAKELKIFKNIDGDCIRKNNNMWEIASKKFKGSKTIQTYQFDDIKSLFNDRIFGIDDKNKKVKKISKKVIKTNDEGKEEIVETEEIVYKEYETIPLTNKDIELVQLIDANEFIESEKWFRMCWIFKSVGFKFELFDELSKKYDNEYNILKGLKSSYSREDNLMRWHMCRVSKINTNLIHHMVKKSNPKAYHNLFINEYFNEPVNNDVITFSNRYLLDQNVKLINDKNDILQSNIINWYENDEIKSFSLKAPYGTGKTQMLKKIFDTYNPKKILWLSYRKTLTNNIIGAEKFGEEYGFKNYQEGIYNTDRLMIQVESLSKLYSLMEFVDDNEEVCEYPSYDLVVIDEVESILNQFQAETLKGMSKEVFEFSQGVITNSKKLIVLDGDIGQRTYDFIDSFGKSIKLVDDIKINQRQFKITDDTVDFNDRIKKDLDKNKKVAIISMSSAKCNQFYDYFRGLFPNKNILVYTGSSDDSTKKDFNDVTNIWDTCDLLIYSPTCEAGVNFDKDHFNKMYGVLSDGSTTPRGLLQMFARIRRIKETEILILNCGMLDNNLGQYDYFNFEDVKASVTALENIKLTSQNVMINGKMCRENKISGYDINYIHNKVESLNAGKYYFLNNLKNMCFKKGHTFEILDGRISMNAELKEALDEFKDCKYEKNKIIAEIEDITDEKCEELISEQKKDNATQQDKLKVEKHILKRSLGLDTVTEDLVKVFNKNSIKKFVSLIDIDNIRERTDNQTAEEKDRVIKLVSLINELGWSNIFDSKKINETEFKTKVDFVIKNNVLFTDMKNTNIRFGLNKKTSIFCNGKTTNKSVLGFVNSLLSSYSVKIASDRVRVKGTCDKVNVYSLIQLNDVNELLEYKIKRGFELKDRNNIRLPAKTNKYIDFVDVKQLEAEERFFKERKEREAKCLLNSKSPLDYGLESDDEI